MNEGWVALHRKILKSGLFEQHDKLALWIYLLLQAQHTEEKFNLGVNKNTGMASFDVHLQPGQLVTGRLSLSEKLRLGGTRIETLLKQLERSGSIVQEPNMNFRKITLVNWQRYQYPPSCDNMNSTSIEHELHTHNNDNNETKTQDTANHAPVIENNLAMFVSFLKKKMQEFHVSLKEEELVQQLEKEFHDYSLEAIMDAFNVLLNLLEKGKDIDDPIPYGLGILKNRKKY